MHRADGGSRCRGGQGPMSFQIPKLRSPHPSLRIAFQIVQEKKVMGRYKIFALIKRRTDLSSQEFHDQYRHPHAPFGTTMTKLRGYVQSHQFTNSQLPGRQDESVPTSYQLIASISARTVRPRQMRLAPKFLAQPPPGGPGGTGISAGRSSTEANSRWLTRARTR